VQSLRPNQGLSKCTTAVGAVNCTDITMNIVSTAFSFDKGECILLSIALVAAGDCSNMMSVVVLGPSATGEDVEDSVTTFIPSPVDPSTLLREPSFNLTHRPPSPRLPPIFKHQLLTPPQSPHTFTPILTQSTPNSKINYSASILSLAFPPCSVGASLCHCSNSKPIIFLVQIHFRTAKGKQMERQTLEGSRRDGIICRKSARRHPCAGSVGARHV